MNSIASSIAIATLSASSHAITVVYSGDSTLITSTGTLA